VRLHGAAGHLEFGGDFLVVAPLQQEFSDLLLTPAQLNGFLPHRNDLKPLIR